MARQKEKLDQKIEDMTNFARQVRRDNTFNPKCRVERDGYYITKNTAFLLEGHSSFNYRRVRGNQRDRIIWEVLENLDSPYSTASDRHIWEEVCVARLLKAVTDRYTNPKASVIVTGIKVPEWYEGDFVDPIKYAEQLAEVSEKHPVFVSTGIRNQRVYDILKGTKVNLVTLHEQLDEYMRKLVTEVFPKDERTPERRHSELMAELLGNWGTGYIIGCMDGTLEPKIRWALSEMRRK